jgi:exosome complex RNA-binding protein Csl4
VIKYILCMMIVELAFSSHCFASVDRIIYDFKSNNYSIDNKSKMTIYLNASDKVTLDVVNINPLLYEVEVDIDKSNLGKKLVPRFANTTSLEAFKRNELVAGSKSSGTKLKEILALIADLRKEATPAMDGILDTYNNIVRNMYRSGDCKHAILLSIKNSDKYYLSTLKDIVKKLYYELYHLQPTDIPCQAVKNININFSIINYEHNMFIEEQHAVPKIYVKRLDLIHEMIINEMPEVYKDQQLSVDMLYLVEGISNQLEMLDVLSLPSGVKTDGMHIFVYKKANRYTGVASKVLVQELVIPIILVSKPFKVFPFAGIFFKFGETQNAFSYGVGASVSHSTNFFIRPTMSIGLTTTSFNKTRYVVGLGITTENISFVTVGGNYIFDNNIGKGTFGISLQNNFNCLFSCSN